MKFDKIKSKMIRHDAIPMQCSERAVFLTKCRDPVTSREPQNK